MFGIGGTEFALILLFAFLIFGPDKLPGMGRTIGRALRQFRQAQEGLTEVVRTEIVEPASAKGSSFLGDEDGEDADVNADDDATRRPTETFAERKARLEAERKAAAEAAQNTADAEQAETSGAPAAPQNPPIVAYGNPDSDEDIDAAGPAVVLPADSDGDSDADIPAAPAASTQQAEEDASSQGPDLAVLYGRSSRRVRKVTAARTRETDSETDASAAQNGASSVSEKTDNSGEEAGSTR